MTELSCPACGSGGVKTTIYENVRTVGDVVRCGSCGTCFVRPRSPVPQVPPLYDKSYYDAWGQEVLGIEGVAALKHATFERLFDVMSKYRSGGRLLDVGCAFGYLLNVAERRGWEGYGVELSAYAAGEARKNAGEGRIWRGDFLAAPLPSAHFDAITMVDLIEHIRDVRGVLARCASLLKDGGVLAIVTPDVDSMSRKWLGRAWPHFNKEHVVYFSMSTIERIIRANGFRVKAVLPFPKALSLYYIRAHLREYGAFMLREAAKALCMVTPDFLKRRVFFVPQGEMLILAEKSGGKEP